MKYSFLSVFLSICSLQAQELRLDSLQKILLNTYEFNPQGQKLLTVSKESVFDTNKVLVEQHRRAFVQSDTGAVMHSYYFFGYNPQSRLGSYYTERFPQPKNPKAQYSKQSSKFKSAPNHEDKEWISELDDKGKTNVYTQFSYDSRGNRMETRTENKLTNIVNTDVFERNPKGQITAWRSYDEENGQRTQVREVQMSYKFDTLLLTNQGYIYNNYTETVNKYDKKNQLVSTITQTGYRQDNGKIIKENKSVAKYKNGRLVSLSVTEKGKKVSNSVFTYNGDATDEQLTTYEGKTKNTVLKTKKSVFESGRLLSYTESENGKVKFSKNYRYESNVLVEYTELELKTSGDEWKTQIEYNERGNPTRKTFSINGKIKQQDEYSYQYQPAKG